MSAPFLRPVAILTDFLREKLVIGAIRFYQRNISPNWPSKCRFIPSCSAYAVTAVRRFGSVRGLAMATCRILRCNPLCKGGYDPVPAHFSLRPFAALGETSSDRKSENE